MVEYSWQDTCKPNLIMLEFLIKVYIQAIFYNHQILKYLLHIIEKKERESIENLHVADFFTEAMLKRDSIRGIHHSQDKQVSLIAP